MAKAKRRTRRKPQSRAGNSMWLWGVVGLAAVAGIYAYQHRKEMPSMLAHAGAVAAMPHVAQEAPVPATLIPKPGPLTVHLKDNHLQYAITWFGLAGVVVVAFGVWWRAQRRLASSQDRGEKTR